MNSKKKVARWLAPFAVVIFVLGLGVSHAYDTSQPPLDYEPRSMAMAKESLSLLSEAASPDVLLIQTAIPWNSTADTDVLNALGYSFDIIDMDDVPNTDINEYQVVLVVNDQVQAFYDNYAANYAKFENYVNYGGTLVFFACDHGWANGNNYTALPGGVQVGDRYSPMNIVSNSDHPIIKQELVDHQGTFGYPDQPLQNADMYGNYCSHNYFVESTLPPGADVLLRTNDTDKFPTLVVYELGNGYVIASGITWEAAYAWWNKNTIPGIWSYGRALPDVFKYAFCIAGGLKTTRVDIYPEDNWVQNDRPTIYKHPGDLLDIVAVITNASDQTQLDVNLRIEVDPADALDSNFVEVFKRASAEEIAIKDPEKLSPTSDTVSGNKRIIILSNLSIPPESQQKWNDFIFRFKLSQTTGMINATATIYGNNIVTSSKKLTDYWQNMTKVPIWVQNSGKIFLTNRRGMYRRFAKNGNQIDTKGASQVNNLWETMNRIAEEKQGVIYHVDKYDQYDPFDPSDNPTHTWLDDNDRENLPYNNGEGQVNEVANLVDSMLKNFIDSSGGIGNRRYVVIVGDDAIVPFYRVFDPTNVRDITGDPNECDNSTVFCSRDSHSASNITENDANNGYLFTDIIYRDYDGQDWGNGDVENIIVGRITGKDPDDLKSFLESSNQINSNSNNVVKIENARRNCELDEYVNESLNQGYTVISAIDGVTLDQAPNPDVCQPWANSAWADDPADWIDLQRLFTGSANNVGDFDIFRAMTHGTVHGIYDSEKANQPSDPYFTDGDILTSSGNIDSHFSNFYPFFIYDACLVGLTDGTGNTFMNAWAPLNTRGIFASTAVTWTPDISDYNDIYYEEFLQSDAGRAVNRANTDYDADNCGAQCSYVKFQMNLFGVPWARVTPPNNRTANIAVAAKAIESSQIFQIAYNESQKNIFVDASVYNVETTLDGYNLVIVDGFDLLMKEGQTPVVPTHSYKIDLPLNTTLNSIDVTFSNQVNLGQLNIPAFSPPTPVITPNPDPGGYIPSPSDIGVFPTNQYGYKVVLHDNKLRVIVNIIPVTFDTATQQTSLYQSIDIIVNYTAPNKGYTKNFFINKETYAVDENIEAYTLIENTSPSSATYEVNIEIKDYLGNVVNTASGFSTINSDSSDTVLVNISAPSVPGNYKVVTIVSDGQNQIGSSEQMTKVINSQIEYFNVPEKILIGDYGTFEIGIKNLTNNLITSLVDFYIYDGQHQIAKLPQIIVSDIGPNETRNVQTQWFPPSVIEVGHYLVQAIATINNNSISTSMSKIEITSGNNPPVANAGPDQTVVVETDCMANVTLDGSDTSDPDGDPISYNWTWDAGSATGMSPIIQLPLGTHTIILMVSDGVLDSDPDTVDITVVDTTPPDVEVNLPEPYTALQDGITLTAGATDECGIAEVYFCVREPGGENGIIIGHEDLPGALNASGEWECNFDTTQTPDGYYVILTKAVDTNGNEGWSMPVPVSIRNWAVVELLPNTANNKAGRTMPVKFALRIAAAVDPLQPFVYNQELEIRIYDASEPDTILQTSLYGDTSTDYRIDTAGELYITNFKTSKTPADYVVEIWRMSKDFKVGDFTFKTVK